jgi:hypothetical protein
VKSFGWKHDVVTKIVDGDIVLGVVTNCLPTCKAEVVTLGGKIKSSSLHSSHPVHFPPVLVLRVVMFPTTLEEHLFSWESLAYVSHAN